MGNILKAKEIKKIDRILNDNKVFEQIQTILNDNNLSEYRIDKFKLISVELAADHPCKQLCPDGSEPKTKTSGSGHARRCYCP